MTADFMWFGWFRRQKEKASTGNIFIEFGPDKSIRTMNAEAPDYFTLVDAEGTITIKRRST